MATNITLICFKDWLGILEVILDEVTEALAEVTRVAQLENMSGCFSLFHHQTEKYIIRFEPFGQVDGPERIAYEFSCDEQTKRLLAKHDETHSPTHYSSRQSSAPEVKSYGAAILVQSQRNEKLILSFSSRDFTEMENEAIVLRVCVSLKFMWSDVAETIARASNNTFYLKHWAI